MKGNKRKELHPLKWHSESLAGMYDTDGVLFDALLQRKMGCVKLVCVHKQSFSHPATAWYE